MTNDDVLKNKQEKNRVKYFVEVNDLMEHLNKESKEAKRQRRRIKDYIEVKDLERACDGWAGPEKKS